MHKSLQQISNTLSIIEVPQELQDAVEKGQMSATAAAKASKSLEATQKAKDKLKAGEKVQVKDVTEYAPMTITEARKVISKAIQFRNDEKSQMQQMKWNSIIHGIEIGVGLRPCEF
jgi:hypothetical protein